MNAIGIRREDKNKWERRVPLIPEHVRLFKKKDHLQTIIQPSSIRTFSDEEYKKHDAIVQEDLSSCPVIFAVKEIPLTFIEQKKTYVFFSHTIKGQSYNMPMLKKMMQKKCTLIDYEKITDKKGRRLVFFGRFAGIAGMIDTLWAFGRRLNIEGFNLPFDDLRQTIQYNTLDEAQYYVRDVGKQIKDQTLPDALTPLVIGFAGYGNVSQGAQEILDLLPTLEITPSELKEGIKRPSINHVYKVVFKEEDMVQPNNPKGEFELQDYYHHPEKYHSVMGQYLPDLTLLMNCIYWDKRYPRLITKQYVKECSQTNNRLRVIGDISVDINGSIEFTEKSTTPDKPVFTYNPQTDTIQDGYHTDGIVVMAVDNLPCELPRESSRAFSDSLLPYVPSIAHADYTTSFDNLDLPPEIKNAVILHRGNLTPDFQYIDKYL